MKEKVRKIEWKIVENIKLKDIFENGQVFRWKKMDGNSEKYLVGYSEYICIFEEEKDFLNIEIYTKSNKKDEEIIREIENYLDIQTDYNGIIRYLKTKHPTIKEALEFGKGIKILNQEKLETLIGFVISANNNIPRIKNNVERICKEIGEEVEFFHSGKKYTEYTFPNIEKLRERGTEEFFRKIGTGFRAPRLAHISQNIEIEYLEEISGLDDEKLEKELLKIPGVGPKVANCIMLFAYHRFDAFPIDVWVRRVMIEEFFKDTEEEKVTNKDIIAVVEKTKNKGLMQQYLFYWRRERGINDK